MKTKSKRTSYKHFKNLSRQQQWRRYRRVRKKTASCDQDITIPTFACTSSSDDLGCSSNKHDTAVISLDNDDSTTSTRDAFCATTDIFFDSATNSDESSSEICCDNVIYDEDSTGEDFLAATTSENEHTSTSFMTGNETSLLNGIAVPVTNGALASMTDLSKSRTHSLSPLQSITAWCVLEPNVPHAAVTRLLQSLYKFHPELPKTYQTLLPKPDLQYEPMEEGLYVHMPNWITSLKEMLNSIRSDSNNVNYSIVVNVDGLPLFKSTPNYKLYPILITIHNIKMRPICVGIYCTEKSLNREMPSTFVYLQKFLEDVKSLMTNPLSSEDCQYVMKDYPIFVCDAPARASLKAIKSHTGYQSCERCDIHGEYHDNRVCMLRTDGKRRSEFDFSHQLCKEHHKGVSALTDFGVPMVRNFVLDYMHLACLGVMKRLLSFWKGMPRYGIYYF